MGTMETTHHMGTVGHLIKSQEDLSVEIWLMYTFLGRVHKKQIFAIDQRLSESQRNSMMGNLNYFYLEDRRSEVGLKLQLVKNQK